jgi:serine protease
MRLLAPSVLLAACAPDAVIDTTDLEQLSPGEYHAERVLVGFDGSLPKLDHSGIRLSARSIGEGMAVVEVPAGEDALSVVAELRSRRGLTFVEPDVIRTISANDPYIAYQWGLERIGAPSAWDVGEAGDGVVVAVVDTGVSGDGSDGFSRLLDGKDYVDDDNDADDENGHGTHVAGTIAQATDNGIGVAGIAPGAAILPVRVLDADGSGFTSDVVAGILYAVSEGADVINLSLGSTAPSTAEELALAAAVDAGVLVVAATGNDGSDSALNYPAVYDDAVAVAATDYNDSRTSYSNAGAGVDLAAPGGDTGADLDGNGYGDGILQETRNSNGWGYYFYQGTSMATPHVAGAAAVLMGAGATADEARALLEATAMDRGADGWDSEYGHGVIDLPAALDALAEDTGGEDPDEDTGGEDPDEDTGGEDVTPPSLDFFEMRPRPDRTRFIVAADEPATLLVCMDGAPCAFSPEGMRHDVYIDTWSQTYSLWLTDAAGNALERIEAPTRRRPRNNR